MSTTSRDITISIVAKFLFENGFSNAHETFLKEAADDFLHLKSIDTFKYKPL
ncbi:hypothetical protein HK096_000110, partial [Nowakowskiella sp. JEL0078]